MIRRAMIDDISRFNFDMKKRGGFKYDFRRDKQTD